MNSHRLHKSLVITLFLFLFLNTACSAKTEAQKKLGPDADYFIGLKLLDQGKQKEGIAKLKKCTKKGSYYCAKLSAEKLCEIGSLQDKNNACTNLVEKYKGPDTLLIAVRQFALSNEDLKLLEYTANLDYETADNELIRLRLETLNKNKDPRYEAELYQWFTSRPLSTEHYQFYRDYYQHPDFETLATAISTDDVETIGSISYTPKQFVMNYRIELYKRNYTYTYENASQVLRYFQEGVLPPKGQVASDIGKSYLYGSMNFANNGGKFKNLAAEFENTPVEFYFWFYAGRLFEKGGLYYTQTTRCFKTAMEKASTAEQKDNALWYLLNSSLNFSIDNIISSIGEYAKNISNPSYFDDFFENLISNLIVAGRWDTFYTLYNLIDGYASDEIVAQIAYIYGRLLEEGITSSTQTTAEQAFKRALNSKSSVYYRIMAAGKLNLSDKEFFDLMAETRTSKSEIITDTTAADNLLQGYVLFGFPQKVYPMFMELYSKGVSTDTAFYLAEFLHKCATGNDDYYQQSLRIAARAAANADRALKKEELQLLYPQNYLEYVDTSCKKYDIKNSIVFALIRSESFFDPDIISSAGAVGLTQLMELTCGDIARKLKYKDYSLEDPKTNIEFGTYYLSELLRRCDNSNLQAFFSYNAGITRVRRWLQSSLVEFGKKSEMPMDLFLETLPYAETREYGRKLVSAGVMYEWLYETKTESYTQIIENIVN